MTAKHRLEEIPGQFPVQVHAPDSAVTRGDFPSAGGTLYEEAPTRVIVSAGAAVAQEVVTQEPPKDGRIEALDLDPDKFAAILQMYEGSAVKPAAGDQSSRAGQRAGRVAGYVGARLRVAKDDKMDPDPLPRRTRGASFEHNPPNDLRSRIAPGAPGSIIEQAILGSRRVGR